MSQPEVGGASKLAQQHQVAALGVAPSLGVTEWLAAMHCA
jgi:hypothetical protein